MEYARATINFSTGDTLQFVSISTDELIHNIRKVYCYNFPALEPPVQVHPSDRLRPLKIREKQCGSLGITYRSICHANNISARADFLYTIERVFAKTDNKVFKLSRLGKQPYSRDDLFCIFKSLEYNRYFKTLDIDMPLTRQEIIGIGNVLRENAEFENLIINTDLSKELVLALSESVSSKPVLNLTSFVITSGYNIDGIFVNNI